MFVESLTVGPLEENCWLVGDESAGRCVLVDPGDDGERILAHVHRTGLELEAIWLTHAHFDHVGGIAAIRRAVKVPIHLHPLDAPLYERAADVAMRWGIPIEQPPAVDRELAEGMTARVGSLEFAVMHAPGHAPGHVVFHGHGIALVGDCLFRGSIGRTDLPLCDPAALMRSLERIAELPPATRVLPGHGPETTIGIELALNPFLNGGARPVGS